MKRTNLTYTRVSWQAKATIGCPEWDVVTPQGELVAIVVDYSDSTRKRVADTEQTAQLMADAPQILNELKIAHDLLSDMFLEFMDKENPDFITMSYLTNQVAERSHLLAKHRHFIANKERGHE